jgi:Protein of unknown function (DUF3105)
MTGRSGPLLARVRARRRLALAAYTAAWLVAAAVVALTAVALIGGAGTEDVSVPVVEETKLTHAAASAGCVLRHAGTRDRLNPPVAGPATGSPARAGFYDGEAPQAVSLVAALRRGVIVIQFRADLDATQLDELHRIQRALPAGTIVVRNETSMPYQVAAVGYRHLLGCRRFTEQALDALQLFRGRYVGSGPDS